MCLNVHCPLTTYYTLYIKPILYLELKDNCSLNNIFKMENKTDWLKKNEE